MKYVSMMLFVLWVSGIIGFWGVFIAWALMCGINAVIVLGVSSAINNDPD